MFSIRTIAVIGALVMATTTAAHAGSKDRQAQRSKSKQREQERARKEKEAEEEKQREEEEEAEKEAQEKAARDKAKKEKERAKEQAKEQEEEAKEVEEKAKKEHPQASSASGGSDEAFHDGTLGFSIPFTVIGAAVGAATGEPPPTVDIVYFLGDTSALDIIVGLNFHRKHAVDVMGNGTDANLIGAAFGLGYRMYSTKNNLRSFIEPQAVISWGDVQSTSALIVNLGASLGLERNVTPWFSVSAQVGATLDFGNSFKDIQLATSARLAANLYWH
jgi:hypothetical protein